MTDWAFFTEFLARPGGLVEYASALLAQSYVCPWLGALVITTAIALTCLGMAWFVVAMGGARWSPLPLVPVVPLVILHSQYDYPLASTLGFLVAILAADLYVVVGPRLAVWRMVTFMGLATGLYYVVAGPYLVFVALCVLAESLVHRRWVLATCLAAIGSAIPWAAARYLFEVNVVSPYTHLLPLSSDRRAWMAGLGLCAVLPLVAMVVVLQRRHAERTTPPRPMPCRFASPVKCLYGTAALVVAFVVLGTWSLDRHAKVLALVDYCARQEDWASVLEHARLLPARRYKTSTRWDVNQALFHTGQLGDRMFAYPQDPSSLLVSNADPDTWPLDRPTWARLGELFLKLGRINEAQFRTHEAMEHLGQRPEIVHRLFLIHMIGGETDPARVALNALGRHLLWSKRAREYRCRLTEDPDLSSDEQVQRARSVMMLDDHLGHVPVEIMLGQLLERNPDNIMAREYLIGYHLLTRQLGRAVDEIGALAQRGCTRMPRHYEEALFLHARVANGGETYTLGARIGTDTRRRGEAFFRVYDRHRSDQRAAERTLAVEFGDTYFFYYTFGETGYQYRFADRAPGFGGTR